MSLDLTKLNREIPLQCPTCGGESFHEDASEGEDRVITCSKCGRPTARAQLSADNAENIDINLKEIQAKALDLAGKHLQETLKNAFKGNKNIKIK